MKGCAKVLYSKNAIGCFYCSSFLWCWSWVRKTYFYQLMASGRDKELNSVIEEKGKTGKMKKAARASTIYSWNMYICESSSTNSQAHMMTGKTEKWARWIQKGRRFWFWNSDERKSFSIDFDRKDPKAKSELELKWAEQLTRKPIKSCQN